MFTLMLLEALVLLVLTPRHVEGTALATTYLVWLVFEEKEIVAILVLKYDMRI